MMEKLLPTTYTSKSELVAEKFDRALVIDDIQIACPGKW